MTDAELSTPCFLISESALLANLACMDRLRKEAGVRMLLALKCFSCWGAFPVLAPYLDGTTSSGPYEARLGRDTLIYREPATIRQASAGGAHAYQIAASSCLAGDVFCTARFDAPLHVGQRLHVHVQVSGGYTMVKLNWFNGLRMPAVYFRHIDGRLTLLNRFDYADFKPAMSLHAIACDGQAQAQLQLELPIE
jgi:diaminopimelate decarboxylase